MSAEETLPCNLQSVLMVKMLMYDTNIDGRASGGAVNIGILHGADEASKAAARQMAAELAQLAREGMKVKKYGFAVHQIELSGGGAKLADELKKHGICALYVACSPAADISEVASVTRSLQVLSVSGVAPQKRVRNGVSVGFAMEAEKPVILVNVQSAAREGALFSPQFLSLVQIIQ